MKRKSTSHDHDEEEEEQKTKEKSEYSGRLRDAALLEGVCVPPPDASQKHLLATHTRTRARARARSHAAVCQDTRAASV